MTITVGNKTTFTQTPASNFETFNHSHNTGADGFLFCHFSMPNGVNFGSCTYQGVSMTLISVKNFSSLSQRNAVFALENPPTGVNQVKINFTGNQWNSTSCFAQSFLGAQLGGNVVNLGGNSSSTRTGNITISANSYIFTSSCSNSGILTNQIPTGTNRPALFTANAIRQVRGSLSASPLSAGITSCRSTSSSNITLFMYEIQEKASLVDSSSNFLLMF